jgi:RND family efflux transporter MFP subunit
MTNNRLLATTLVLGLAVVGLIPGCKPNTAPPAKEPVNVTVFHPVEKSDVVDYMFFTGHAAPVEDVDVKPRVSGYLQSIRFVDGGLVQGPYFTYEYTPEVVASLLGRLMADRLVSPSPLTAAAVLSPQRVEGEVLFEIDPRPYQAVFDQVASQVALAEAKYNSAKAKHKANEVALKSGKDIGKDVKVVSEMNLITSQAAVGEAEASWKAAQTSLEAARLDLEFTKVRAPVSGKISRNLLTKGNLVTKDQTKLARIVSQDPMYVYFDIDEQSVQELQILRREGGIDRFLGNPVWAGLAKDKGQYPLEGILQYAEPDVDPSMGSRTFRAVFPNRPAGYLLGGNFVRVKVSKGQKPYPAPVVPERALVAEQGKKYLLVCDANNKVRKELVKLGAQLDNGLRVILPPDSPAGKKKVSNEEWVHRWVNESVILDGVGEAQDKGDVVIDRRYQLVLATGKLLELKDTAAK